MNFEKLQEMSRSYEGRVYLLVSSLTQEEKDLLIKEIETWDHKHEGLIKMNLVFKDFCNLDIPVKDFQEFLKTDLKIALDVHAQKISNTNNKELAVDSFLMYLGIGCWPRHGGPKDYVDLFHRALEAKARSMGYWMESKE